MLKSLLCLLLLASPLFAQDKPGATVSPNKVKGVTMPASIIVNDTDVTKRIVPVFDNPAAVLDVKYKVISSGETDPVARPKGSGKKRKAAKKAKKKMMSLKKSKMSLKVLKKRISNSQLLSDERKFLQSIQNCLRTSLT
jgi:hypothetical protein